MARDGGAFKTVSPLVRDSRLDCYNTLTIPEREPGEQPTLRPKPARVLSLAKWKKKMADEENEKEGAVKRRQKELDGLSVSDMGFKLLELIAQNRPDYQQMRSILDFAMQVFSEPKEPDPDKPAS